MTELVSDFRMLFEMNYIGFVFQCWDQFQTLNFPLDFDLILRDMYIQTKILFHYYIIRMAIEFHWF